MPEQCVLRDRILRVGDHLIANSRAYDLNICRKGVEVTVNRIKIGEDGPLIGLESKNRISGWHSLDGTVPNHCGFWATRDLLMDVFEHKERPILEVVEEITFKGHSLKGVQCKLLVSDNKHGLSFVELEKNVGGGSADGLGKAGYCISLPNSAVKQKQKVKEAK